MEKGGEGERAVGVNQSQVQKMNEDDQQTKEKESIPPKKKNEYESNQLKEMKAIIEKQEERIQKLQSNAFQLANYYFVFQGVILTVVCKPSALKCSDKFIPFGFSLSVAVLNLFALILIGLKYKNSLEQQDKNRDHLFKLMSVQQPMTDPHRKNIKQGGGASQDIEQHPKTGPHRKNIRYICYFVSCMVIFVFVAIITGFACLKIPCREDYSNTLSGDDKCIKPFDCGKYIRLCTGN